MTPVFSTQPDPALPLFLMNPAAPPGVAAGYQIGFWATSAQPWPQVPFSIRVSWNDATGIYLFMNATPSNVAELASALTQLLATPAFSGARFLWLANPNDAFQDWNVQQLAASQPAGIVTAAAQLVFQNYAVSIGAGSTLAPSGDDGFSIAAAANAMGFSAAGGAYYPLTGGGSTPNLPFSGNAAGCVALSMAVSPSMPNFFDDLNTGIWYFRDDPTFPGMAQPLRYPVFSGAPPSMTLAARFDPINPLAAQRTLLGFPIGAAMGSWFRSNHGVAFALAPASSTFTPYVPSLVFSILQNRNPPDPQAPYSMIPAGAFSMSIGRSGGSEPGGAFVPPAARLMCGIAGTEYLGLAGASGALLQFAPGQPAYVAPDDTRDAPLLMAKKASQPLLSIATTSWCYASPATTATDVTYFAQPADAALYSSTGSAYLEFLEVPSAPLPQTIGAAPPWFPMAPYAGIVASDLAAYEEIETKVLSPTRRNIIASLNESSVSVASGDGSITGVTPPGLLVTLDTTRTQWEALTIARHGDLSDDGAQTLLLHDVQGGFRAALQTNQLFAVLRDPVAVMDACELEYEITDAVLHDLRTKREPVPPSVTAALVPLKGTTYESNSAFQAALQPAMGSAYAQYGAVVTQYAAKFGIELEGWRFRLAPTMWAVISDRPTLMLFKYAAGALADLARDVNSWTWSAAAGSDPAATQEYLLGILNAAAKIVDEAGEASTDLDYFVDTVMRDPAWNGILFLNANVPVTSLPAELSGVVSGIDPAKFVAHHLGIELTTIDTAVTPLQLSDSAFFGLILYDDPVDLYFNGDLYDFKVLLLDVLFRNSTIANFASRVELMANAWFGELGDLTPSEHNNNLILDGSYQKQGDTASYVFERRGSSRFVMRSAVLEEVEITKVQFVTLQPPQGSSTAQATSRFLMWGDLRYHELVFDLFSFGPSRVDGAIVQDGFLRFSGLSVDMASDGVAGGTKTFAFNARGVAVDAAASLARPGSVYAQLPLVIGGLLNGTVDTRPADLGYVAVKTPLSASALDGTWYGLAFQVDLGTLGALAGQVGFVVSLLAAWAPATPPSGTNAAQTKPPTASVQVGLLLPGGRSLTSLVPIQGVVSLGFSGIDLTPSVNESGTSYILRFRRFVLSLLGWSFPPGQADLAFFTNPNNSGRSALGWYAAYLGSDGEERS